MNAEETIEAAIHRLVAASAEVDDKTDATARHALETQFVVLLSALSDMRETGLPDQTAGSIHALDVARAILGEVTSDAS